MMKRVPNRQLGPGRPPHSGGLSGGTSYGSADSSHEMRHHQGRGPQGLQGPSPMRRDERRPRQEAEHELPGAAPLPPKASEQGDVTDETLLVIEDLDNGRDYYMAVVDQFPVGDRDYIVFTHYTMDTGDHREPDFVLMRVLPGDDGQQYYASIRDKEELDIVFEKFFERMQGDLLGEA